MTSKHVIDHGDEQNMQDHFLSGTKNWVYISCSFYRVANLDNGGMFKEEKHEIIKTVEKQQNNKEFKISLICQTIFILYFVQFEII